MAQLDQKIHGKAPRDDDDGGVAGPLSQSATRDNLIIKPLMFDRFRQKIKKRFPTSRVDEIWRRKDLNRHNYGFDTFDHARSIKSKYWCFDGKRVGVRIPLDMTRRMRHSEKEGRLSLILGLRTVSKGDDEAKKLS